MIMSRQNRQGSSVIRQRPQPVQDAIRPNEGTPVAVILGQIASVNGLSIQTASLKLGDAPVPERKYVADMCGVEYVTGTMKLFFGQRRIGSDELRSLLVIHMSPSGAARFLAAADQLSPKTLDQLASEAGIKAEESSPVGSEPTQTVAFAAALVLIAASVDETTMDFYQASTFALSAMANSGKLSLDPVVRIDLRTSLLLGLVANVRKLSSHFPTINFSEMKP
jgi:hypothetical protein